MASLMLLRIPVTCMCSNSVSRAACGAVLPLLYGYLAHVGGDSQVAYWLLLPCYAMILYYAIWGHKLTHWRRG
jgi:fucose permease